MIACDFSASQISDTVTEITVDLEIAGYLIRNQYGQLYRPVNENGKEIDFAGLGNLYSNYLLAVHCVIKRYQEAHNYVSQ